MNTTSFLQKNLEALVRKNSPIAHWLSRQPVDVAAVEQNVFQNRWNIRDWRMPGGKGLFEAMPPNLYYNGWGIDESNAGTSATFIVGCNLGYGLNHVLVNTPNSHKVVVLEPDYNLLVACLSQTDYTPFLELGKLFFLPPEKEMLVFAVQQADVQFLFGRIYLRVDTPSQQLGPEYARWTHTARELLENFSVELATLRLRQDTMVGNELNNFRKAMADGSISGLADAAAGVTAVILGAGPSLASLGPGLARLGGNVLYTTALQTLPAVHAAGITPHLAMAIDYSAGMKAVFERLDPSWAKHIPLLYSTKLDPEVLARYPGPAIPVWTQGGLGTFIMKEHEYVLDAGGNVSVALYRLLRWFGVQRVLLVGQDFAWKGTQSHVAGHHAAGYVHTNTMELQNRAGETILSTLSYVTALRDIEKSIAETGLPTYNLYGGGAIIDGARELTLDELAGSGLTDSESGSRERFLASLKRAHASRPMPRFDARAQSWTVSLRNVTKRLEKHFKKLGARQEEIWATFKEVHQFLRHDPLYLPYLYNEVMDVAGLMYAGRKFELKDMIAFKAVVKRILAKVREIDEALAPAQEDLAAAPSRQAA